jgi:hypothetical protein
MLVNLMNDDQLEQLVGLSQACSKCWSIVDTYSDPCV